MTDSETGRFSFLRELHEKHWKKLMIMTFLFLLFSVAVLGYTKLTTGDFIGKDVSLSGGIVITVQSSGIFDLVELKKQVEAELGTGVLVKSLRSAGAAKVAGYSFEIATQDTEAAKSAIEKATGLQLTEGSYTIDQTSPTLGASFFQGMIKALLIAFVFMSIVVFLFFRVPVPSAAVILAAVSDVTGTLAIMNLLGIPLSTAGVAAFLMLVGYSVDTDILLSAKVLKSSEGSLTDRIAAATKTGLTMQLTSLIAFVVLYFVTPAPALKSFSTIAIIGLGLDIFNTWIQNAGILRWYVERKNE